MLGGIAFIALTAILHRFRGGGVVGWKFPLHRRFVVAPCVGLAALLVASPWFALGLAVQYLVFVWPGWGRWYTVGYGERAWSGEPDRVESVIERTWSFFPQGTMNDVVCFATRNVATFVPTFCALAFLPGVTGAVALAFCGAVPLVYLAAWYSVDEADGPTGVAEWGVGFLFGACALVVVGG